MHTREEHIERHEAAFAPIRELLESMDESTLESPTASGWTAKEMLGHLAFWAETVDPVLGWVLEGENPPPWTFGSGYVPGDEDWPADYVHNAREAEWAKGQSAADVMARLDAAHTGAIEAIRKLQDDRLVDSKYDQYLQDSTAHYVEHFAELKALTAGS